MSGKKKSLFGLSGKARTGLAQKMLEKRLDKLNKQRDHEGGTAQRVKRKSPGKQQDIPEAFYRFDQMHGYQQLQIMEQGGKHLGIPSPFFKVHEGIADNETIIGGRKYINYANYNYLDLSGHEEVNQAAIDALQQYGSSASASRPVAGERPIQREFEKALASHYDTDDAIVFVSGHATNVTTIGYLFGSKDLILHDSLIHNSILQGIQLSGAKRMPFPHNDWEALQDLLERQRHEFERVLIVVEGIYSMDGDYPDLPQFIELKNRYKAFLMVDEAHSLGVLGEKGYGIREHFDLHGSDVDIWMGTLSKTLSSCGGYIAGESALIENLKYFAPGFLYSVGISPPLAAASLKALEILHREPERVAKLKQAGNLLKQLMQEKSIDTGHSAGLSVIPAIIGSSAKAGKLANQLFDRGINVQPIFYPAVEERMARLRFFVCSSHTEEQIRQTVDVLHEEIGKL